MLEEPAADDGVHRRPQLEQKRLASSERPEPPAARAGLPEVDLVHVLARGQEVEPVTIGDGDEGVHEPFRLIHVGDITQAEQIPSTRRQNPSLIPVVPPEKADLKCHTWQVDSCTDAPPELILRCPPRHVRTVRLHTYRPPCCASA